MNEGVMRRVSAIQTQRIFEDDVKALHEEILQIPSWHLANLVFREAAFLASSARFEFSTGWIVTRKSMGFTGKTQIEGPPDNFGTRNSA